ncbi:MAG: universal stress protein, partial [Actinobacteria bacterium]|nr:universal stress protein [Actinomycetota bacterium]
AVMLGVFGSEIPPGITAELAEGTAERVLVQRSREASLLVLGAAGAHLAGRPAGPVIRACMRSARCPLVIITATADAAPATEPPRQASMAGARAT